jgi:penicillin-binding protein 1A
MNKINARNTARKAKPLLGYISRKWHSFWTWYGNLYRNSPWYKKTLVGIISFIVVFFLYLGMVDWNFLWLFGKSPSLRSIQNPDQPVASEIYSADGKLIGKYFRENRMPVKYEEISPKLIKTLVTTEDERFYHHFGIDFQGLFSAAKDMVHGHGRGASTITQQLVKNMFKIRSQYSTGILGIIPGVRLMIMKSKEWINAVKIEMFYSKKEILTMYLNTVDFGSNAYGIKTAAKTYFNTTPAQINYEQASVLVGMLRATTYYNPRTNPKNAFKRRNVVLDNLRTHHVINREECDSLKEIPIKLNYAVESNYDGIALYFREAVANELEGWLRENDLDLYSDGLKIYTTIDTRMQKYAEEAVNKEMRQVQRNFNSQWGKRNPWCDEKHQEIPHFIEDLAKKTVAYKILVNRYGSQTDSIDYYLNKPHKLKLFDYDKGMYETTMSTLDSIRYMERYMHCGFIAMEPQTGFVKAWVGDINFEAWKYDKVTAQRQPGSTFKLFDYTAAMNHGMSPCDTRQDHYLSLDVLDHGKPTKWIPRNANGNFTGREYSLKAAFAQSINTIAVQVAQEVGIHTVAETAKAMGIKTPLEETPALSLGASDVTLEELVDAYSTVINDGKQHDPILVTRIEDKDGNTVFEYKDTQVQVIPYESAFLMQEMLKGGLTEPGGTTQALWEFISPFTRETEFGGKTGTSQHHSDAWFVGVTPKLVAGAWVGAEHRSIHFLTGAYGQGSRTALPVYGYFMQKVLSDPSLAQYRCKFPKPKQTITREYNCQDVYYSNKNDSSNVALDDSTVFTPGSNDADEIDLEDNSGTEQPKMEGTKEKKKEKEKEKNNEVVI